MPTRNANTYKNHYSTIPLLQAAQRADKTHLQELLNNGVPIDQQDSHGHTALHITSDPEIALLLLQAKANFRLRDIDGRTPLHSASARGNSAITTHLLHYGAKETLQDERGHNALHLAAESGSLQTLKHLLHALQQASEHTTAHTFKHALDMRTNEGQTALHIAANKGHADVVALLIQVGANPNLQDAFGQSPLHLACEAGQNSVVLHLLNCPVDKNIINKFGLTAQQLAEKNQQTTLLSLLTATLEKPRSTFTHSRFFTPAPTSDAASSPKTPVADTHTPQSFAPPR